MDCHLTGGRLCACVCEGLWCVMDHQQHSGVSDSSITDDNTSTPPPIPTTATLQPQRPTMLTIQRPSKPIPSTPSITIPSHSGGGGGGANELDITLRPNDVDRSRLSIGSYNALRALGVQASWTEAENKPRSPRNANITLGSRNARKTPEPSPRNSPTSSPRLSRVEDSTEEDGRRPSLDSNINNSNNTQKRQLDSSAPVIRPKDSSKTMEPRAPASSEIGVGRVARLSPRGGGATEGRKSSGADAVKEKSDPQREEGHSTSPRGPSGIDSFRNQFRRKRQPTLADLAASLTPEFSRALLMDPLRARHFRDFLEAEHADENLTFYVAVEAYRTIVDEGDRRLKAREIFMNFVDDNAACQVNLASGVRDKLALAVRGGKETPIDLFDMAQQEVFNMLRSDKFQRFMSSMFYDLMVKALQLRSIVINPDLFSAFLRLCDGTGPEKWELTLAEDGLEVYNTVDSQSDTLMLKTRCTIYRPATDILRVVSSPRHKVRYDRFISGCEVLKEFDETFKVLKFVLKLPSVIAKDRDAICGMITKQASNGDCFCISRSIDWPDEKASLQYVRAEVETSGYLIQPATEIESLVTYILQVNLRGTLPQRAIKKLMKRRTETLRSLRVYMNEVTLF